MIMAWLFAVGYSVAFVLFSAAVIVVSIVSLFCSIIKTVGLTVCYDA